NFYSNLLCRRDVTPGFPWRFAFVHCTRSVVSAGQVSLESLMPVAASRPAAKNDVVDLAQEASAALDALLADAMAKVRERVVVEGHVVGRLFDREQRATHGLAWFATYVEAVRQLGAYAARLADDGILGEAEALLVRIGLGEFLAQVAGGIPMSQGEVVRPSDLGLSPAQVAARINGVVERLITAGNSAEHP